MLLTTNSIVDKEYLDQKVDFESGAVLLIDKPLEWTSFDVVNKLRFKIKHGLGIKKIKVGHAGTLDPLATGLLLICTGKLTKEIDKLQGLPKKYSGTITLGAVTPTYDSEVEPTEFFPIDHINQELIEQVRQQFIGMIEQVPPIYSAVKIEGKSAYTLARRGEEVTLKSRNVEISRFDISEFEMPILPFICDCSKGTYIRSLANDFGKALDSGAFLSSLRRDAIGDYKVDKALSIEEAIDFIEKSTS